MKTYGSGEWNAKKQGGGKRRKWRKLHLAVDESTGNIVADSLTDNDVHDQSELPTLVAQIESPIGTLLGEGAYDTRGVYESAAAHAGTSATVIVPPRKDAVVSSPTNPILSQRDQHIITIAEVGRPAWEVQHDYCRRLIAENARGRFKRNIGPQLRSRRFDNQVNEAAIGVAALNRMTQLGTPRQLAVMS